MMEQSEQFPFGMITKEEFEQVKKALELALKGHLEQNNDIANELVPRAFDALYAWATAPYRVRSPEEICEKTKGDAAWSRNNVRNERDLQRNRWRWYAGMAAALGPVGAVTFANQMTFVEDERFGPLT